MMQKKLSDIFSGTAAIDLFKKAFIMLSVLYIFLFIAETILPGLIVDFFNFNILLVLLFADLFLIGLLEGKKLVGRNGKTPGWSKQVIIGIVVALSVVLLVVLYRISLVESMVYLTLILIIGRLLYGFMK